MLHVSVALTTVIPLFAGLNPWISSQRALLRTLPPSDGTCSMPESGRSAARHLARAHSVRGVAYAAGKPQRQAIGVAVRSTGFNDQLGSYTRPSLVMLWTQPFWSSR